MARRWVRLVVAADGCGGASIRGGAFRDGLPFAKAATILGSMGRERAAEAVLARIGASEERGYGTRGTIAGGDAGRGYGRAGDAGVCLAARAVAAMLGVGSDHGDDAVGRATAGAAAEAVPVSGGSPEGRRGRGQCGARGPWTVAVAGTSPERRRRPLLSSGRFSGHPQSP